MASDPKSLSEAGQGPSVAVDVSACCSLPVCDALPFIRRVRVDNVRRERLDAEGISVSADPPQAFPAFTIPISPGRAMAALDVPPEHTEPRYDWEYLAGVKEEAGMELTFGLLRGGTPSSVSAARTKLLPPWIWPGAGTGLEASLAFFALSGAPAVLADSTAELLKNLAGDGRPEAAAEAVWTALRGRGYGRVVPGALFYDRHVSVMTPQVF
ncbi:MAG: hypothetical protein LBQ12_14580, partial [Deltaproteobacteria bacterium]|nr:hypothetical protein [Deltaproteobacteria bacterium]